MDINIKQLRAKLEKKKQALMTAVEGRKKTSKKIKISPFLFFGVTGAVAVFLLFNLVLMPAMGKKSSSSNLSSPVILRVVEAEHHFNKGKAQAQFNSRKIVFSAGEVNNGSAGTGNTGAGLVVPPFKPALRPNPFN